MLFRFTGILFTVLAGMAPTAVSIAGEAPEFLLSTNAISQMKRGRVIARTLPGDAAQPYFLYVPRRLGSPPRILVTVHGISRNAEEHAEAFAAIAERYGVVILAPLFRKGRFTDYQRLGRAGRGGERADLALRALVEDVGRLTGARTDRFYLFGHSGGAQFAHRYVMAHPDDVVRYAISAAGWYTLPDPGLKYPYGTRLGNQLPGVQFDLDKFLRVPVSVLVGERDTVRDKSLNRSARIDARLGKTRIERARSWNSAMARAARRRGIDAAYALHVLPGTSHDFTDMVDHGNLDTFVADFLFGHGKTPHDRDGATSPPG